MNFKVWFRRNFFAGILVLIPLLGTVALFSWLFDKITGPGYGWLLNRFGNQEHEILGPFLRENQFLFRFVVLFLMLGLTVLVGVLARNIAGRRIIRFGETFFENVPIVNRIYKTFKQISQAFLGQDKINFNRVVAVEYPRKGVYALGFVTSPGREDKRQKSAERLVTVLLPTTPNPTSGSLVILPEKETFQLDMTIEDALKVIISGGAVTPTNTKPLALARVEPEEVKQPPQPKEVSSSKAV
jgi:uncharacterized membrane protein